jgi:hypothetical protein
MNWPNNRAWGLSQFVSSKVESMSHVARLYMSSAKRWKRPVSSLLTRMAAEPAYGCESQVNPNLGQDNHSLWAFSPAR